MEFVRHSEPRSFPSRGLPPADLIIMILIEDLNVARGEKMEVPKSIGAARLSIEQETKKVGKGDNEPEESLYIASITISNSRVTTPFLSVSI
jgi:hypothetical protein